MLIATSWVLEVYQLIESARKVPELDVSVVEVWLQRGDKSIVQMACAMQVIGHAAWPIATTLARIWNEFNDATHQRVASKTKHFGHDCILERDYSFILAYVAPRCRQPNTHTAE